jgi:transcriptional regulator with XRE-family HTH domain
MVFPNIKNAVFPACYSRLMENSLNHLDAKVAPGETIRNVRKQAGLTLSDVSAATGLAVSTLSKIEMGRVSLSFDKLTLISRALHVDIAELLDSSPHGAPSQSSGPGRRVVQRAGEGQLVETHAYKQHFMATELLHKRFTPILVEICARTLEEFAAEFGSLIRHPGEEFTYVIEGELEFHSELYAPVRLRTGDSIYFDSEMGHAYIKVSAGPCRVVCTCAPRGREDNMFDQFVTVSEKSAAKAQKPARVSRAKKR